MKDDIQSCLVERENLEAILDSISDGIVAIDEELRIVNLNRAAREMLGDGQDVRGYRIDRFFEPASPIMQEGVESIRNGEKEYHTCEVRARSLSGKVYDVVLTCKPLVRKKEGVIVGMVLVLKDVTRIKGLESQLQEKYSFHNIIGKDSKMQEIFSLISEIADSDATVLIQGESGTGKELVAHAIHAASNRASGPFVKVHCAALPESLLESELFGHVKGAFTSALYDKVGRFQLADGGTIFLDEIGDISPAVQAKLLRVLQEKVIERVGDPRPIKVDVRIIAATNRDLVRLIEKGEFREDLYYRLRVVTIELPPLRERRGDIPLLVEHFIKRFSEKLGKSIEGVSEEVMDRLLEYDWPGNVRELENAMEFAVIKCKKGWITFDCLPPEIRQSMGGSRKDRILQALRESGGKREEAARLLGISRVTLWRWMKEEGLL